MSLPVREHPHTRNAFVEVLCIGSACFVWHLQTLTWRTPRWTPLHASTFLCRILVSNYQTTASLKVMCRLLERIAAEYGTLNTAMAHQIPLSCYGKQKDFSTCSVSAHTHHKEIGSRLRREMQDPKKRRTPVACCHIAEAQNSSNVSAWLASRMHCTKNEGCYKISG